MNNILFFVIVFMCLTCHFFFDKSEVCALTCMYLTCILGDVTAQVALQPALKFNGGGHINHTIFWTNLSPNGGGEPQGETETHPNASYFSDTALFCS